MNVDVNPAALAEFASAAGRPRKSADQRIADVTYFAGALDADLHSLTPQQLSDHAASYREAAKRCADYVSEGHHPECHMVLIAFAGRYATKVLVFEAALQDRGLA